MARHGAARASPAGSHLRAPTSGGLDSLALATAAGRRDAARREPAVGDPLLILGGGVTGLSAGLAARAPVFEMDARPGGICRSYYVRPDGEHLAAAPPDGEAYRFERGGGHWIFGGDPVVLGLVRRLGPVSAHARRALVYLRALDRYVPYPLQHNLRLLGPALARTALDEMRRG